MKAANEAFKVRYANGCSAISVRLITAWNRDFIDGPIMSNSSGPKDLLKNQIWGVFNAEKDVDRIVMVRASGPPFLLLRRLGCWFDVTGTQVVNG